ncbi:MAG: zinc-dependent metalloprotease [Chitinophagaceae bacterium]|nr:zinc-dependent metalloprotease [Chitinophagaceae bacterium]
MKLKTLLLFGAIILATNTFAQRRQIPPPQATAQAPATAKGDTTAPKSQAKNNEPKPYEKVITSEAVSQSGFLSTHKVGDNYYLEIPDSMMDRDILVVNRISKAPAGAKSGFFGYGGDQIGNSVINFSKGPKNNVFLKTISFAETASDSSENGMYRSLKNSNVQPLEAAFDIAAFSKDKKGVVIDITKYIGGDNDVLFFSGRLKRSQGLGQLQNDRSYIIGTKAFPTNVEIQTVKTYMKTPQQQGQQGGGAGGFQSAAATPSPVTYELNSSLVLLPKVPMQARYFDPRVGYFATSSTDFDANPQGVKRLTMAVRWRLEPKDEDLEKYKRGELVEPKKQIVYYIDPVTPKKWVPYLIAGVNDWQKAFEQAGFKNAIVAKEAPVDDPSWSLEDARHSAIVYKPSSVANASGPNVHDPRSGEIIESHINWYHNVMELVRNWYFIQASVIDPRAQRMEFSDELMGDLIRFVSSHEVGHTLGLRHNYGSSSTTPVEKLRDKNWLAQHGHTPSIMDYARFNYVAQPGDGIDKRGIYPRIGEYDKWAIQWGYMYLPQFKNSEDEAAYLTQLTTDSLRANKRLYFGTETDPNDPRNQNEDLGDNSMLASAYGIKNLQRIMPNILKWTSEPNKNYDNAATIYRELVTQFRRYIGHVAKNVGGIETTPTVIEEKKPAYVVTPKARQKEAIKFLQDQVFTTPKWLIDNDLYALIGMNQVNTITGLQKSALGALLSTRTLNNLVQSELFDPVNSYTLTGMLGDLKDGIWKELKTHQNIDVYRRNLQKAYVESLVKLIKPAKAAATTQQTQFGQAAAAPSIAENDASSILKGHARALLAEVKAAIPLARDNASKLHLQDIADRLRDGLDPAIQP